jgi:hypothetical protein
MIFVKKINPLVGLQGYNVFMVLLIVFLPVLVFAHVVQDDVSITKRVKYSLKEACTKSGFQDSPLIDVISGTVLDCMGRKIQIADFCDKELSQDPYYLRGYIDDETKEVVCVSGKKVLFKYQCVKLTDKALCSEKPPVACRQIHKKLARRLDLVHSSFVKTEKGIKQLNCFFESLPLTDKKHDL